MDSEHFMFLPPSIPLRPKKPMLNKVKTYFKIKCKVDRYVLVSFLVILSLRTQAVFRYFKKQHGPLPPCFVSAKSTNFRKWQNISFYELTILEVIGQFREKVNLQPNLK